MAKEEKGYWFSTENGTHIHAEEGESKEQAMSKKFSNFGKGKKEEKGNKEFDKINAKRMGVKQPEEDIFDDDYQRSYGVPTFDDETDVNKLVDTLEKAWQYGDSEIENNIFERLEDLVDFTQEDYELISSGTGDEISNMIRNKTLKGSKKEEPKEEKTENYDNDPEVEKESQDIISSGEKHTYMMLDRMRSDLEYALGTVAETRKNHPEWFAPNSDKISDFHSIWWSEKPYKQIALMRKLHNSLKEKPEWLTMEQINDFEKRVKEHLGN